MDFDHTYFYDDKPYMIICVCQMKHPESRQWIPAICYRSLNDGTIYVREEKEFLKLFNTK